MSTCIFGSLLAACNVLLMMPDATDKRRIVTITCAPSSGTTAQTAPTARTSPDPLESSQETTPHPWAVGAGNRPTYRPPYRPGPTPPCGAATADSGRLGGVGGTAGDPPSPAPFLDLSSTPPHAATSPNGWPTGGVSSVSSVSEGGILPPSA